MRSRAARLLRHPVFVAACLLLSVGAWVVQLAPTNNVYWISPGCSLEVGRGGGGLWVWAAERGTFELLGPGFHVVEGSLREWAPEFRIDRGMEITLIDALGTRASVVNGVFVHLPAWIAGAVLLAPPLFFAATVRRRRRGHCACGYDLAGLSGRCPECGCAIDGDDEC